MLSHVFIGVNRFDEAFVFYAGLAELLQLELKFCDTKDEWAGWVKPGVPRPLLVIGHAYDGNPATPGNGQMTALLAPSRAIVERCHQAALGAGGRCEGPPGLRPLYHANYYGAYFRDLDGNKLCVCCHESE